MQITMEGFQVRIVRKRIKNINLRINSQGEVTVSAPLRTPLEFVHRFLEEKRDWIEAGRRRAHSRVQTMLRQGLTGETYFFLGKSYSLQVHEDCVTNQVRLEADALHCFVRPNTSAHERQWLLKTWYHKQLQQLLPDLIKKWESIIGVQVKSWGIKAMKSRWGSCHPGKQHISISSYLAEKPLACVEYVVVHELVHILEASHNARFYALLSEFMPDWKIYHNQLKGNPTRHPSIESNHSQDM